MACNCKVNQQVDYLTKKYGVGGPRRHDTHMSEDILDFLEASGAFILSIIAAPFLLLYILGKLIFSDDKTLHIEDLLVLKNI